MDQIYTNNIFTKPIDYDFSSFQLELHQINCDRNLQFKTMIQTYNQIKTEIDRIKQFNLEREQATYEMTQISKNQCTLTDLSDEFIRVLKLTQEQEHMKHSHLAKVALLNEEKEHNQMNIKLLFNSVFMEANQCVRVQAMSKVGLVTYASYGGFLAILIVKESVNVLELWDFSSSKTDRQVHMLKQQLISIDILVKEGKVYIAELDDRRVLQIKYWGAGLINEIRLGKETSSIKLLDDKLVLFSQQNSTIHLLKWNGELIYIIDDQEIGDILKIDDRIIVQSHPNMTEFDVQKGTAMDLQGRAIKLGDNSIGYVIDDKLHFQEEIYDINPLYASDQIFGIIFVDQDQTIRLLDKKSKAVRESSIPTSIEQKFFICINQNLVFGDAMGDLYYINRIMDYFN